MDTLKRWHRDLATLTLNLLILLVLINVALGMVFLVSDRFAKKRQADARVQSYREKFADLAAYRRIPAEQVPSVLDEMDLMASQGFEYAPWVEFRAPKFQGAHINTDERGFRATVAAQPRGDRPLRVDLFGGSTAFGWGLSDEHTIASYLQRILEAKFPETPIRVRNFGQPFYYSSQTIPLLQSVLKDGEAADWAIFLDGGNDTAQLALRHDVPIFTPALQRLWKERNRTQAPAPSSLWTKLPLGRAAMAMSQKLAAARPRPDRPENEDQFRLIRTDAHLPEAEVSEIVEYVRGRYLANLRVIRGVCAEFGVRPLFFWQPHPAHKYDRNLHKTFPFDGPVPRYFQGVYARMESHAADDYRFLGHLTEGSNQKAYIDDVHYNEPMSELIAQRIADSIHRLPAR